MGRLFLVYNLQIKIALTIFLTKETNAEIIGEEQSNFDFSYSEVNVKILTIVFKNVINQQCGLDSKLKNSQTLIIKCL